MSDDPKQLDALIDEALRDLAAGEPREGFRGRVLARIASAPEPAPVPGFEILGWHVRPYQLAAVGAVATLGLIAALVIPPMLRQPAAGSTPAVTAARPPAAATQPAHVPAPVTSTAQQVRASGVPARPAARPAAVRQAADRTPTDTAEDDAGPILSVSVNRLSDPNPIVNRAIEIKPLEIQPLVIPEIQVPSLDSGSPAKSPGSGK